MTAQMIIGENNFSLKSISKTKKATSKKNLEKKRIPGLQEQQELYYMFDNYQNQYKDLNRGKHFSLDRSCWSCTQDGLKCRYTFRGVNFYVKYTDGWGKAFSGKKINSSRILAPKHHFLKLSVECTWLSSNSLPSGGSGHHQGTQASVGGNGRGEGAKCHHDLQ